MKESMKTTIRWHRTDEELPKQKQIELGIVKKTGKPAIGFVDEECLVIWNDKVKRSKYITSQKRWEGHLEEQVPEYWVKISEIGEQ